MYMALYGIISFFPGEEISSVNSQVIDMYIWVFLVLILKFYLLFIGPYDSRKIHARFEDQI